MKTTSGTANLVMVLMTYPHQVTSVSSLSKRVSEIVNKYVMVGPETVGSYTLGDGGVFRGHSSSEVLTASWCWKFWISREFGTDGSGCWGTRGVLARS
jgi:hypothetical protein